jgi:hypothetical protein
VTLGFDSAAMGTVLRGVPAPTTGGGDGAGAFTTDGLTNAGGGTTAGVEGDGASAWPAGAGDKTIGRVGADDGAIADAATPAGAAAGRA